LTVTAKPDRDDLIIFLSGGMFESSGIASEVGSSEFGTWPPAWPVLPGLGDRGQVRAIVHLLNLTKEDYDDAVDRTRSLLADPELQRWIARVSTTLVRKGYLSGTEVEALRPDRRAVELQEAA
jgi:hypothetical protein